MTDMRMDLYEVQADIVLIKERLNLLEPPRSKLEDEDTLKSKSKKFTASKVQQLIENLEEEWMKRLAGLLIKFDKYDKQAKEFREHQEQRESDIERKTAIMEDKIKKFDSRLEENRNQVKGFQALWDAECKRLDDFDKKLNRQQSSLGVLEPMKLSINKVKEDIKFVDSKRTVKDSKTDKKISDIMNKNNALQKKIEEFRNQLAKVNATNYKLLEEMKLTSTEILLKNSQNEGANLYAKCIISRDEWKKEQKKNILNQAEAKIVNIKPIIRINKHQIKSYSPIFGLYESKHHSVPFSDFGPVFDISKSQRCKNYLKEIHKFGDKPMKFSTTGFISCLDVSPIFINDDYPHVTKMFNYSFSDIRDINRYGVRVIVLFNSVVFDVQHLLDEDFQLYEKFLSEHQLVSLSIQQWKTVCKHVLGYVCI